MSTNASLARDGLQAAARTVIITLAGAADAQRLLQDSRSLQTAVAEMEALLDSADDTPREGPEPDLRTACPGLAGPRRTARQAARSFLLPAPRTTKGTSP
ncbi:hypothetical protein [Streptomyces rochei]|uniref:Uncharacterized protein n=1 Tax=Streptomyces rochei TaxID=1928 RepID=A0AAX3ZVF4_STRRO|nr:hypothetical protein [Streptomyces rochei]WMC90930.1 hypothetical protein P7W03_35370 [Streptomyces rochei]